MLNSRLFKILLTILLLTKLAFAQEIEVWSEANKALAHRMKLIAEAPPHATIKMSSFIFSGDNTGQLLTYELIKALQRGVKAQILVDAVGLNFGKPSSQLLDILVLSGAEIKMSRPVWKSLYNFNRRMHDKILMVHDNVAVVGGRNLWDPSFELSENRHLDVEVLLKDSKSFNDIEKYWQERWNHSSSHQYKLSSSNLDIKNIMNTLSSIYADFINHPQYKEFFQQKENPYTERVEEVKFVRDQRWKFLLPHFYDSQQSDHIEELIELLSRAKNTILIESPWLVLTTRLKDALQEARQRGVEITILTNSEITAESWWQWRISRSVSDKFLRSIHAHLYEFYGYQSLHSKYIIVDNYESYIGSFNFGPRSEKLNSETGVIIKSKHVAERLSFEFMKRLRTATPAKPLPQTLLSPCVDLVYGMIGTQL